MISLSCAAACSTRHCGVRFAGAGQSTQRPARQNRPESQDMENEDGSWRIDIHDVDSDEDSITGRSEASTPDQEEVPAPSRGPSWKQILKVVALGVLAISGSIMAGMALPKSNIPFRNMRGSLPPQPHPVIEPPLFLLPTNATELAIIPRPIPLPIAHPDALPYPAPALSSQWPQHVELLASSSQNHYSYFSEHGSDYTNNLADGMVWNGTHTLGQTHADMREQGYPIRRGHQYPISSADVVNGRCLNAWDKRDMHKHRFALLLDGGRDFRQDCRKWKDLLKTQYNVPGKDILYYPDSDSDDVSEGLRRIQQRIEKRHLPPGDVEVMVYYSGHGRAYYEDDPEPLRDGEAAGTIALEDGPYREATLRDSLRTHLPDIPTAVILDACQSGAWIA